MVRLINWINSSGDPLPSVHWYRNDKLIDDSDMKTLEKTVKNRIVLKDIVRSDLKARYKFIYARYSYFQESRKKT